jgi:hypothetical protein
MSEIAAAVERALSANAYSGKVIGVFTSGGDAQGMNSAVRAVVRCLYYQKLQTLVYKYL